MWAKSQLLDLFQNLSAKSQLLDLFQNLSHLWTFSNSLPWRSLIKQIISCYIHSDFKLSYKPGYRALKSAERNYQTKYLEMDTCKFRSSSSPRSKNQLIYQPKTFQLLFFCFSFFVFYLEVTYLLRPKDLSAAHRTRLVGCVINCPASTSNELNDQISNQKIAWSDSYLDFHSSHSRDATAIFHSMTHTREMTLSKDMSEELMTERVATTRVSIRRRRLNTSAIFNESLDQGSAASPYKARIAQLITDGQLRPANWTVTRFRVADGLCLLHSSAVAGCPFSPNRERPRPPESYANCSYTPCRLRPPAGSNENIRCCIIRHA